MGTLTQLLLYEAQFKDPRPNTGYKIIKVMYFEEDNQISVEKNGKITIKKVPADFLKDSGLKRYDSGKYPLETTDIAFILTKCPDFKALCKNAAKQGNDLTGRGDKQWEKIKLDYKGHNIEAKWGIANVYYSERMKEVIEISKTIHALW